MEKINKIKTDLNKYYIYSMTLIFMFFYSVLILTNSDKLYEIAENMGNIKTLFPIIIIISFGVSVKFAIDGIMQILIKNKKKLGIYSLSGNKNTYLAYIITKELIKSLLFATILGILLGVVYSFFIRSILEMIFEISNISLNIINFKIFIEYIILILFVIIINYLIAIIILNKKDIKDLMNNENILKVEDSIMKKFNIFKYLFITVIIIILSIFFYFLAKRNLSNNLFILYILLFLICLSLIIYRLSNIMITLKTNIYLKYSKNKLFQYVYSNELKRNWKKYYINQCMYITIIVLSTLLLFISLIIGYSYRENIEKEAPFDLAVSVDAKEVDFSDIKKLIDDNNILDKIEYKIYDNLEMKKYDLPIEYIKLSDYNHLRKILNKDPVYLKENEFLIQVEDNSVENEMENKIKNTNIYINDKKYFAKNIEKFPFLQSNINGRRELAVFNDEVIEDMKINAKRNVFIVKFKNKPLAKLKNEIFKELRSSRNLVKVKSENHVTIKVVLKEWSRLNGLVGLTIVTIMGIFIGSILLLIGISSISFFSIKNLEKLNKENNIYFNLGWSLERINKYNAYRIKAYYINSFYMLIFCLIPSIFLGYIYLKDYIDKDLYIILFGLISFFIYLCIMIGYKIILIKILNYKK